MVTRRGWRSPSVCSPFGRSTRTSTRARHLLEAQQPIAIPALSSQDPAGSNIGMAGEWHVGGAVEDAHARGVRCVLRRQHEGRLAQIEFGRERLHLAVTEAACIWKNSQRIAAEAPVSEHVDSHERIGAHRHGYTIS